MKKNRLFLSLFLAVILIIVVVVLASGSIGFGGGYKVTVQGTVSYNPLLGWSCSVSNVVVEEDTLFGLWYWPWDTKDINVKVQIDDKTGEAWLGTVSSWFGGSKTYEVTVHGLEIGSYTGKVYVYEVEKEWLGFTEGDRVLQKTVSFEVNVV